MALKTTGRLQEAIAQYLRALELSPKDRTAHFNLAAAYEEKGDILKAVEHYRKNCELGDRRGCGQARRLGKR